MEIYVCDMCQKIMKEPYGKIKMEFQEFDSLAFEEHHITLCKKCYNDYIKDIIPSLKHSKNLKKKLLNKISKKNIYLKSD